jgi:hypothetical protein
MCDQVFHIILGLDVFKSHACCDRGSIFVSLLILS